MSSPWASPEAAPPEGGDGLAVLAGFGAVVALHGAFGLAVWLLASATVSELLWVWVRYFSIMQLLYVAPLVAAVVVLDGRRPFVLGVFLAAGGSFLLNAGLWAWAWSGGAL